MKLQDFGLWFDCGDGYSYKEWSTIIPENRFFFIYYDGERLGWWSLDLGLTILLNNPRFFIKMKVDPEHPRYKIDGPITLDDFEIIEKNL